MERRSLAASMLIYAGALMLAAIILAPIAWLFVMSISSTADLTAKPLHWWPESFDLSRYRLLTTLGENAAGTAFLAALRNSLVVAGMAVAAAMVVAVPAGWAVSRTPRIGWSLQVVVGSYMLPPVALAVPLYMILARLG